VLCAAGYNVKWLLQMICKTGIRLNINEYIITISHNREVITEATMLRLFLPALSHKSDYGIIVTSDFW